MHKATLKGGLVCDQDTDPLVIFMMSHDYPVVW